MNSAVRWHSQRCSKMSSRSPIAKDEEMASGENGPALGTRYASTAHCRLVDSIERQSAGE